MYYGLQIGDKEFLTMTDERYRKKPMLVIKKNNTLKQYGTFKNEELAQEFFKTLLAQLNRTYKGVDND